MTEPRTELIVAPDVEGLLIDYLTESMPELGYPGLAISDTLTARESVALYRIGGQMRDLVTDSATIALEVRASTKTRAVSLIQAARALIHDLPGRDLAGRPVYRVGEFAGPGNLPTEDSPIRYTVTLTIDIRADTR